MNFPRPRLHQRLARAQDKGKPLSDWRSRLGGDIGQQLGRMRKKP